MVHFIRIVIINILSIVTSVSFADFQKISNEGNALPAITSLGSEADDWACIHDSNSNLIWEIKTANGGLRDIEWTYSWLDSNALMSKGVINGGNCFDDINCDTEKYIQQVNKQSLCGANDWRLPTLEDFFQLWLYNPLLINGQHSDATKGFWSSTTPDPMRYSEEVSSEGAIVVLPPDDMSAALKSHLHGVRLVRDGKSFVNVDFRDAPYKIETWPFPKPGQIILGEDETLFITDLLNHRIVNLNMEGVEINSFGQFSAAEASSLELTSAPDGTLYVADQENNRIQHFKADGHLISEFSYKNQLGWNHIKDMVVTSNGNLFLVFKENVQYLNAKGEIIWEFHHNSADLYGMEMIRVADNGSLSILNEEPFGTSFPVQYKIINLTAEGKFIDKISYCCPSTTYPEDLFPKKRAVSTKEGIVFEVVTDSRELAEEGSIQKKKPNLAKYSYTHDTGIAIFENISVGNEHYWVSLKTQGNSKLKVVKAYLVKPGIENNSSTYDPKTGLATLPRVAMNGTFYSVILKRLSKGVFNVESATPL